MKKKLCIIVLAATVVTFIYALYVHLNIRGFSLLTMDSNGGDMLVSSYYSSIIAFAASLTAFLILLFLTFEERKQARRQSMNRKMEENVENNATEERFDDNRQVAE